MFKVGCNMHDEKTGEEDGVITLEVDGETVSSLS